jgi:hypothetical protein
MFSALPPNSEVARCGRHFAFVPKTAIGQAPGHVSTNPHATMSAIDMTDVDKTGSFSVNALSVERNVLLHALRNTAQVGLTALHIFQHIYPEKFELLGVMQEMQKLRNENI